MALLARDDKDVKIELCSYYVTLRLERFFHWGQIKDLKESIEKVKLIIERTAYKYKPLAGRLNNLGIGLVSRYERTDKTKDLEEIIRVTQ